MLDLHEVWYPFSFVVSAWFFAAEPLRAQSAAAEETGLRIARDARVREDGFSDFAARQVMALRNRQGRESRRQLRVQVLEVAGDGNKSLFVFDEPRDVRGPRFWCTRTATPFAGSSVSVRPTSPACGALTCTVIERVLLNRRSNYSRHLVWLRLR